MTLTSARVTSLRLGGAMLAGCLLAINSAHAASEKVLYAFGSGSDGSEPAAGLVDVGGTLYGATQLGGATNNGTVFSITPSGAEKVVYTFQGGNDGERPDADLIDVGGTLYGTTLLGGPGGTGTVFSVTPAGVETVLYAFDGKDGAYPSALLNVGGTLYGTAALGGRYTQGTVFSITTSGTVATIYSFTKKDGVQQPSGPLIEVGGTFYGVSAGPGAGAVYSVTPSGSMSIVYAFPKRKQSGADGFDPVGRLVSLGGTLYGVTEQGGGSSNCGFDMGCGTVFSVTPTGTETVLHAFEGGNDGNTPLAGLLNVGGTLYGTTSGGGGGGGNGQGTVYSITPAGAESVLYAFQGGSDGARAAGDLTKVKNTLYGTTQYGGTGNGTVFTVTLK